MEWVDGWCGGLLENDFKKRFLEGYCSISRLGLQRAVLILVPSRRRFPLSPPSPSLILASLPVLASLRILVFRSAVPGNPAQPPPLHHLVRTPVRPRLSWHVAVIGTHSAPRPSYHRVVDHALQYAQRCVPAEGIAVTAVGGTAAPRPSAATRRWGRGGALWRRGRTSG